MSCLTLLLSALLVTSGVRRQPQNTHSHCLGTRPAARNSSWLCTSSIEHCPTTYQSPYAPSSRHSRYAAHFSHPPGSLHHRARTHRADSTLRTPHCPKTAQDARKPAVPAIIVRYRSVTVLFTHGRRTVVVHSAPGWLAEPRADVAARLVDDGGPARLRGGVRLGRGCVDTWVILGGGVLSSEPVQLIMCRARCMCKWRRVFGVGGRMCESGVGGQCER